MFHPNEKEGDQVHRYLHGSEKNHRIANWLQPNNDLHNHNLHDQKACCRPLITVT